VPLNGAHVVQKQPTWFSQHVRRRFGSHTTLYVSYRCWLTAAHPAHSSLATAQNHHPWRWNDEAIWWVRYSLLFVDCCLLWRASYSGNSSLTTCNDARSCCSLYILRAGAVLNFLSLWWHPGSPYAHESTAPARFMTPLSIYSIKRRYRMSIQAREACCRWHCVQERQELPSRGSAALKPVRRLCRHRSRQQRLNSWGHELCLSVSFVNITAAMLLDCLQSGDERSRHPHC
jgi:hypothetical protein